MGVVGLIGEKAGRGGEKVGERRGEAGKTDGRRGKVRRAGESGRLRG